MTSGLSNIAYYTVKLLSDLNCNDEWKKVDSTDAELKDAIKELKELKLDDLCAIEDDKRQELTTHQQKVIECYAKLKRVLLEVYRDLFLEIKKL